MDKTKRVLFKSEEIVRKTKIGWVEMDASFPAMYHNAWSYIAQLNGVCARDFLLWVISKIDENNTFVYSRNLYNQFIADLRTVPNSKEYEENTVHIALREFIDKNIARKLSRGVYQLNPGLFIVGDPGFSTVKQLTEERQEGTVIEDVPEAEQEQIIVKPLDGPVDNNRFTQGGLFSFDSFVE